MIMRPVSFAVSSENPSSGSPTGWASMVESYMNNSQPQPSVGCTAKILLYISARIRSDDSKSDVWRRLFSVDHTSFWTIMSRLN
jgi:hypothetical protein